MTTTSGSPDRPVVYDVVDNHAVTLAGVRELAARRPDDLRCRRAVLEVAGLDLDGPPPDVVVLDLFLGRDDTPSVGSVPALISWGAAVLVHTSAEFPVPIRQAVAAGASGLSLKNDGPERLHEAILDVARGGFACSSALASALLDDPRLAADLTVREAEVLGGINDGLTRRQVAKRLDVAESTVTDHLKSVRAKYLRLGRDVTNAQSLVREARRDGWIRDV